MIASIALSVALTRPEIGDIVRHLPECRPAQVSGCKVNIAHHRALASFERGNVQYFVKMHHGHVVRVERFQS